MPESVVSVGRDRAVIVREDQARTDRPRPQWQGLFREPEWPPLEEDED